MAIYFGVEMLLIHPTGVEQEFCEVRGNNLRHIVPEKGDTVMTPTQPPPLTVPLRHKRGEKT